MSSPRFLLVHGVIVRGLTSPPWPSREAQPIPDVPDGGWISWRLVGANNRELGRAADVYLTAAECLAGIDQVRTSVAKTLPVLVAQQGLWRWQLSLEGKLLAVSARSYQRQRESRYIAGQFVAEVGTATAPTQVPPITSRRPAGWLGATTS